MTNKPKIVYPDADINDEATYHEHFERLRTHCDLTIYTNKPDSEEEYIRRIQDADGLLIGWDIPKNVMKAAPNLKSISFTGIGVEKFIDLPQATLQDIIVTNCPGYADDTVAEHTFALLLAVARNLPQLNQSTKAGKWTSPLETPGFEAMELRGKTIGLIGYGGIAKSVEQLCRGFEMKALVWTRNMELRKRIYENTRFAELDYLYEHCDIISIHLAANEDTHHFVNEQAFEQMKPGAILINTSRGEVVDEDMLVKALISKRIRAAALDVFSEEPLSAAHPLTQLDNVLLTPHVAFNTPEATQALFSIAIDNLINFFNGSPTNMVNLKKRQPS